MTCGLSFSKKVCSFGEVFCAEKTQSKIVSLAIKVAGASQLIAGRKSGGAGWFEIPGNMPYFQADRLKTLGSGTIKTL